MPLYKCHKQVNALLIKYVIFNDDGSGTITPYDDEFSEFDVSAEYMNKHKPENGGYYVCYADGYKLV